MFQSKLSIIIPTLNEEKNIGACLRAILAQNSNAEIIVSDAGSSDKTLEIVSGFKKAKLVSAPPGRAKQMNLAAKKASGEILCFLHADSVIPPSFVDEIARAFSEPRIVSAFFRYSVSSNKFRYRLMEFIVRLRSEFFKIPYGDQAICVRKSIFDQLGGYPEVAILEDLYLVRSLKKLGAIKAIPLELKTSARRYEEKGFLKLILIHWMIVIADWLGLNIEQFARRFR